MSPAVDQTEEMLAEWVREPGVPVLRRHRLVDLHQTEDEVVAVFDGPDGRTEKAARHLVGRDGGRGAVRKPTCTRRVLEGEDARADRWAGRARTECGLRGCP